ncbi:Small-conductance mechanosensitive channel [Halogranum amylolyticum]|uniref:Small-conductance mechanosensitive channel n=1 Tax=Halogranum amylolyticum TaxID=660520 RepID=A0A1H8RSR8_9EURY|nr:mechanosensitive ion channel family protein [Halogranum amylolyticum]SEO69511.1 Small-conductance mechanosensitive channel [Halogranum amylolyticum]
MTTGWHRLADGVRLQADGASGEQATSIFDFVPWVQAWPPLQFLVVILFTLMGAYLSTYILRLLGRPVARQFSRESVAQTVLRGVRAGTIVLFALLGMTVAGLEIGNIVLSLTVLSAVLGIILAPIVGSVINGLFVLADQPYEIGDMIELDDGTRGFVDDITLRYTKIITLDNTFLVITNSAIRERDVTNYSAEDERTRLSLDVLVTYECDVQQARELIERAARQCEEVVEGGPDIRIGSARYPATPRVLMNDYGDHGVLLRLRYWAKKPYKIAAVQSNVRTKLWGLVDDADVDVEFAYPHQHHVFDETSGRAEVAVTRGGDRRYAVDARPETDPEATAETESGEGTVSSDE